MESVLNTTIHMGFLKKLYRFFAIRFNLKKNAHQRVISFWQKGGADFDYYEKADTPAWLNGFWSRSSIFLNYFKKLDLEVTLEIACGSGRHSAQVINEIGTLYLIDTSREAMQLAKQRFKLQNKVIYLLSAEGYGIPDLIPDNSLTAVFSYDAMVHFEKETVFKYIEDSYRKMKKNGCALFHHSNYFSNPNGKFTQNPGWRNFMSQTIFIAKCKEAGFEILESRIIDYSCPASDCLTLVKK